MDSGLFDDLDFVRKQPDHATDCRSRDLSEKSKATSSWEFVDAEVLATSGLPDHHRSLAQERPRTLRQPSASFRDHVMFF